ncbi:MAG TPA: hypothetical protein VGK73_33970 [Polyangiaceae bacterium]
MPTSPHTHPELYRSLLLDGQPSPGVVTLSNCERQHGWEKQSPKGQAGEFTVNKGPKNSAVVASFYLVDDTDVGGWDSYAAMLSSTVDGPKPKAMSAYHPDLARNKITDLVVESIGILQHDGKGGAHVTVKFLEFRPPKPKPASKAAAAPPAKAKRPDPNAAAKRELAALLEQAKVP